MKKILTTFLAAAAIAVAFSGCASTKKAKASKSSAAKEASTSTAASTSSTSSSSTKTTKKANPYVDYDSQDTAEKAAGFTLKVPASLPFSYTKKIVRAIPNDMIEIIYTSADTAEYIDKVGTADSSTTINNSANKSSSGSAGSGSASSNSSSTSTTVSVAGDEVRLRKAKGNADISGDLTKYLITKNMAANINKADSKRVELRGEVNNYHVATWVDGDYSYAITSKKGLTEAQILALADLLY